MAGCGRNGLLVPLDRDNGESGDLIRYEVAIEGELPEELRRRLRDASNAERLVERPPASPLVLRRRAEDDLATLQQVLRSEGYYAGEVRYTIETVPVPEGPTEGPSGPTTTPGTRLTFEVVPGPQFTFGATAVEVEEPADGFVAPSPAVLGLDTGAPAAAETVLRAEERLLDLARRDARPLARLGQRTAIVDHDLRTMDVTLRVAPGPQAAFGTITFAGDAGIAETFLRRRLPFETGDAYDPELVTRGRRRLIETNLFSTVITEVGEELDAEGRIPVTYRLRPRLHRTIGGGLSYQTDVGPGINAYWEHRNLLSSGERLRADLSVAPVDTLAKLSFRKPEIWTRGLSLLAALAGEIEDTDAYKSESVRVDTGVEYEFTEKVIGGLGIAYRYGDVRQEGERDTFALLSFPARLSWDFSDDLLDPARGGRVQLFGSPYFDTMGNDTRFLKTQVVHTRYVPLLDEHRLVLALRAAAGSISGADRDTVPADERLYSGGGGSIRGIGYQLAGPLDDRDDPIGGRSNLEFSVEARSRFTETLGAVAFLDGGSAFTSQLPNFGETLRFGAGLGLRYITGIGPIRLDLAVPVNRRRGVDDPFQLYVSIGQAF